MVSTETIRGARSGRVMYPGLPGLSRAAGCVGDVT
jgi:hypothetical protein